MSSDLNAMRGIVHGKVIELENDLGLPEGQQVAVTVQPMLSREEAIRRSFGGWAEDAEELDEFLQELRRDRQQERPEPSSSDQRRPLVRVVGPARGCGWDRMIAGRRCGRAGERRRPTGRVIGPACCRGSRHRPAASPLWVMMPEPEPGVLARWLPTRQRPRTTRWPRDCRGLAIPGPHSEDHVVHGIGIQQLGQQLPGEILAAEEFQSQGAAVVDEDEAGGAPGNGRHDPPPHVVEFFLTGAACRASSRLPVAFSAFKSWLLRSTSDQIFCWPAPPRSSP